MDMSPICRFITYLLFIFEAGFALAKVPGMHYGYTDKPQKIEADTKLFVFPTAIKTQVSKNRWQFNDSLAKDVTRRYQDIFGYSFDEQSFYMRDRDRLSFSERGQEAEYLKYQDKQQSFGKYIMRKFVETKLDQILKEDEKLQNVYDIKERVSSYETVSKSGLRFKARYNISGNFARLQWIYPWLEIQYLQEFSEVSEQTLTLIRELPLKIRFDANYAVKNEFITLVGSKNLSSNVKVYLSFGSDTGPDGYSVRQKIGMLGVNYWF